MPRKKENKRADGYYEIKCIVSRTFDGKPVYKSFYSQKSKADARQKAEAYKLELIKEQEKSERMTFGEYAVGFLERSKGHVKQNTYDTTYDVLFRRHLIPYFGEMELRSIKKADIENYIILKQKRYKQNYVKRQVSMIAAVMNDAMLNGYITFSPVKKMKYMSQQKSEKRVYTPEQTELVLEYCKQDAYGLQVHIMLSYGMSRSEFLGITLDDVDFDNLTISINKGAVRDVGSEMIVASPKNAYRNRTIAISQETADWIKNGCKYKWIANTEGEGVMPQYHFKKQFEGFMQRMHEYYLEQGIDVPILNAHELRHTRATLWVNQGKNLFAIAEMLGWSDLSMLRKVYGHPDIQELRKNLEI